jgi:hypothetical protein
MSPPGPDPQANEAIVPAINGKGESVLLASLGDSPRIDDAALPGAPPFPKGREGPLPVRFT